MSGARDRQSDLAVMEAEEYKQKTLLKQLLDQRNRVNELANKAREQFILGKIDERARNTMLLYAVQDYISEGWTLLLSHAEAMEDADEQSQYLTEPLGRIHVMDEVIEFAGLIDVLTAQEVYVAESERVVEYPQGPPRTVTESESRSVPRDVSWAACRLMDEFLAKEHGIELQVDDMDDSLPLFGFDEVSADELNVETIEDIKEATLSGADTRALENGDSDG